MVGVFSHGTLKTNPVAESLMFKYPIPESWEPLKLIILPLNIFIGYLLKGRRWFHGLSVKCKKVSFSPRVVPERGKNHVYQYTTITCNCGNEAHKYRCFSVWHRWS
jgi:hypothetical protein